MASRGKNRDLRPMSRGELVPFASKYVYSFSVFTSLLTDERTEGRTDGQTENIMPPSANLARRMHNKTSGDRCDLLTAIDVGDGD